MPRRYRLYGAHSTGALMPAVAVRQSSVNFGGSVAAGQSLSSGIYIYSMEIIKNMNRYQSCIMGYDHRYINTRSSPHMGTAIAVITLKLINIMPYRWEHFRVGFPIFASIFMQKKTHI